MIIRGRSWVSRCSSTLREPFRDATIVQARAYPTYRERVGFIRAYLQHRGRRIRWSSPPFRRLLSFLRQDGGNGFGFSWFEYNGPGDFGPASYYRWLSVDSRFAFCRRWFYGGWSSTGGTRC